MIWGNSETGEYRISHETFDQHYRRFVLIYGGWIAALTMLEVSKAFPDLFPQDASDSLSILMAFIIQPAVAQQAPALVTPQELGFHKRKPDA